MRHKRIFRLAESYLENNDFGVAHTERVFDIGRENFNIPEELEDLVFACLILHDVGGSSIEDQYEKGPIIATSILEVLGYDDVFIKEVCDIIRTHHDHPRNPSRAFEILYDSDKLAMLSKEEFYVYDSRAGFDWDSIIASMYNDSTR
ncbi:MAG: HD domain-containing protein, partial [candidate division WOR-3 bacterium]